MITKQAVYSTCGECGRNRELISKEEYGCDNCKKPIDFPGKGRKRHHDYLRLDVFRDPSNSSAEHLHFCSWKCVLTKLRKIKSNYFVNLPFLHYELDTVKGQSVRDFLKLLKS